MTQYAKYTQSVKYGGGQGNVYWGYCGIIRTEAKKKRGKAQQKQQEFKENVDKRPRNLVE